MFSGFRRRWYEPNGYKEIVRVSLPLVASMASTTVMQFTDRLFLGRYSVDTIAAALPAGLASLTCMLTLLGICGYGTVLIAQYVGAGNHRQVGVALWQSIWCALAGFALLASTWWIAEPLFAFGGHEPNIQELEIKYFRVLNLGAGFCLLGAAVGGFFSGRGQTRLVMVANVIGAVINVPLDYVLIYGGFGIPALGITGAALATVFGWFFCFVFLSVCVFTKAHEKEYAVLSCWKFDYTMFRRLLWFGIPSGFNMFIDLVGISWFAFEMGLLGKTVLAASTIAFSINSVVFTPLLGLNMGVAALTGQAMGRGTPSDAEKIASYSIHLGILYAIPFVIVFLLVPDILLRLFFPPDISATYAAELVNIGRVLLAYIALYLIVDVYNIIYFGLLKGAGDTVGVLMLLCTSMSCVLVMPIVVMKYLGVITLHGYWITFVAYVFALAFGAHLRFKRRKWHKIRMIEAAR